MAEWGCYRGLNSPNPTSSQVTGGRSEFHPYFSTGSCSHCPVQTVAAAEQPWHFINMKLRYALLLMCIIMPLCASDSDLSNNLVLEPYDKLFDTAVEAYYRGDWLSVILNMEKALRNKATVRNVKAQCRLSCANQSAFGDPLAGLGVPIPGAGSVDDLGFFQKVLKRADCVSSCEAEKLGSPNMHLVGADVELEFKKRTPYNYLQVAYFKVSNSVQYLGSEL